MLPFDEPGNSDCRCRRHGGPGIRDGSGEGITPAHDPNDFEVGKRHGLAEIDVMTDDGRMGAAAGAYAGLDRFEARKKIVEDLKASGLLEKVTEHAHSIGICERSKTIVEPRISTQWFCRMKRELAAPGDSGGARVRAGKRKYDSD